MLHTGRREEEEGLIGLLWPSPPSSMTKYHWVLSGWDFVMHCSVPDDDDHEDGDVSCWVESGLQHHRQ